MPSPLKADVARVLGSAVVRAVRTYGGYGPSATYVLTLADGRRAFFKGTYPLPEGSGVRWTLEREALVYRRLGHMIQPWAPAYLGSVRAEGWHALLLDLADGRPILPWTEAKAKRAARAYAAFHASTLGQQLPRWLSRTQHRDFAVYWQRIARDGAALDRVADLGGRRSAEAREWLRAHGAALSRAEQVLWRADEPFALLHFDTRSDNLRLNGDALRMFDWPYASVGPPEFDVAAFAQSIEAEGGPTPEAVIGWYESVLPLRRDVLVGSLAGIAGYFADRAPRPAISELPRLRTFQRIQLMASLSWAARALDLPPPSWVASIRH